MAQIALSLNLRRLLKKIEDSISKQVLEKCSQEHSFDYIT
jgi:hypothetical protein